LIVVSLFQNICSVTASSPCLTILAEYKEVFEFAKTPVNEHYFENTISTCCSISEIDIMEIWAMF